MNGLHRVGLHLDPNTGVSSVLYHTDQRGALKIWDTAGVWHATDEDGYPIPGLFRSADEALENAESHTNFQYDDEVGKP